MFLESIRCVIDPSPKPQKSRFSNPFSRFRKAKPRVVISKAQYTSKLKWTCVMKHSEHFSRYKNLYNYCFQFSRYGHAVVEHAGCLLLVGGATSNGAATDSIVKFDLKSGSIEQIKFVTSPVQFVIIIFKPNWI